MTQPSRPRGVVLAAEVVAAIVKLRAQGKSAESIAKALGVAPSSVYSHSSLAKRVPCPRCGTPKIVRAALCRRCAASAPERAGWAQQPQKPGSGVNHTHGPAGGTGSLPGGKTAAYWECAGSPTGAHEWVLDEKSAGSCTHCGGTRQFVSWMTNNPAAK